MSNNQTGSDLHIIRDVFKEKRIYTVGTTHGTAGFCLDPYGMITGPKLMFLSNAKTIEELLRTTPELIATWKLVQETDKTHRLWLHATIESNHACVGFSWRKSKGNTEIIGGVFDDKRFDIDIQKYPMGGLSVYVNVDTGKAVLMPIQAFLQVFVDNAQNHETCADFFSNFLH